ncbi:MAG: hypothetical protein ACREXX_00685 [Gammaproteobacteria bacterium]
MDRSEPDDRTLDMRDYPEDVLVSAGALEGRPWPRAIIAGVDAEGNRLCAIFPPEVDGIEW